MHNPRQRVRQRIKRHHQPKQRVARLVDARKFTGQGHITDANLPTLQNDINVHQKRMTDILNTHQTALRLPWLALVEAIARLLQDDSVQVPQRLVQALPGGGSLFVMPALDAQIAITKLITFTPGNASFGKPVIQGDVVIFDIATGERTLVLHGPTVTARRTAAVSVLAARQLAQNLAGPLLIVGAGVQGKAHLEAFADVLGVKQFMIASRCVASAHALVAYAKGLGCQADVAPSADAALADCSLVITCTPASSIALNSPPRQNTFISAVGAFTPQMAELSPAFCKHIAENGTLFVDSTQAYHEAGDLLQAGLNVSSLATLKDVVRGIGLKSAGPVLFKSCGWAGWDLAAARLAVQAI